VLTQSVVSHSVLAVQGRWQTFQRLLRIQIHASDRHVNAGNVKTMKKAIKKTVSEYGGMEKYTSKKAEMKHEKKEGKKVEAKEKMMYAKMKKKK
jgi:hypothetical protein